MASRSLITDSILANMASFKIGPWWLFFEKKFKRHPLKKSVQNNVLRLLPR